MVTARKGFLQVLAGEKAGTEIQVLYYPPEYTLEKSNSFTEVAIPGLEAPYLQFVRGNAGSLSIEVFYDTYEQGTDVRTYTDQLTSLLNLDTELHAPPPLCFTWGMPGSEPFTCVLERVSRRFTLFNEQGIPVRARLTLTLKEYKGGLSEREMHLQSADRTKVFQATEGDSLWSVAAREYGDPSLWRTIARKNGIEDPRSLEPGQELVIPPLEED
jgi:hypothetical protein